MSTTKIDQKSVKHKNRKKWKTEKVTKIRKCKSEKSDKMTKLKSVKQKNVIKILRLTPPMSISALKPGPVVPPGTEKRPDQAARISQSVDFGHLSDILTILGGSQFLTLFYHLFWFYILSLFVFLHFDHFLILVILVILCFSPFRVIIAIRP